MCCILQHVDYKNSTVCGYLKIQGLTEVQLYSPVVVIQSILNCAFTRNGVNSNLYDVSHNNGIYSSWF